MPQVDRHGPQLTNHHIHPRAAVTLLAPLLAGAMTVTAVIAPTFTADAGSAPGGGSPGAGTYIVKLADAPVAAYEGGLPRLKRTAPPVGGRLDADSATVRIYVAHLDDRRERILDTVPGVESLYDYVYTFNGFAAELTGRQAAKLAATPGVVSVTRNTVTQLTDTRPDHGPGTEADGRAETYIRVEAGGGTGDGAGGAADGGVRVPAPAPGPAPALPLAPEAQRSAITKPAAAAGDKGVTTGTPRAPRAEAPGLSGAQWFGAARPDPDGVDIPSAMGTDSHGTHTGTTAAGNHVGAWADAGSDEQVDLPPGDYDVYVVYVVQYDLPAGTTSRRYTLWSWKVGQGAPVVTPAGQTVSAGDHPKVTVAWPDAVRGERYVGVVEFGDGSATVRHTPLTITP